MHCGPHRRRLIRIPNCAMRYHYDNSAAHPRNPNHPPKRVEAGNRATDEMAHLWLQIMPESPHESRRVYADAWAKQEVAKNPRNYAADVTMGPWPWQIQPGFANARFNFAHSLAKAERKRKQSRISK